MKQIAIVYGRRDLLFFRAWSQTDAGMWIEDGACEVMPTVASSEAVGEAVLKALAASRTGLRQPSREGWKEVARPLLEAAGVKAWPTFSKSAKAVSIEREERISLLPLERDERGAFGPLRELEFTIATPASTAQIGDAIRAALAVAR